MILLSIFTLVFATIVSAIDDYPSDMLSLMNGKADPCDDFYEYACGGWTKTHKLKPIDTRLGSTDVVRKRNSELLKEMATEHAVVGAFWDSCMNTEKITHLGNDPLQKDLHRIVDAKSKEDVMKLAGEFSRTGAKAFHKLTIDTYSDNWKRYTLFVGPTDPTIHPLYYSSEAPEYVKYINDILKISGFTSLDKQNEKNKAERENNVGKMVFTIEAQLLNMGSTTNTSQLNHRQSVTSLSKLHPKAFGAFWNGLGLHTIVKDDVEIFIKADYLHKLDKWIESTSIEDLKLYVAFMMVHSRSLWMGDPFYQVWFKMFGKKANMPEPPTREKICEESILKQIPDLIGKYFYDKSFDAAKEKYASQMLELIRQSMEERFSTYDWIYKEDMKRMKGRLNDMIFLIGHSKFPKSYPSDLSRHDYYANMHQLSSHNFDLQMKQIEQRVNRHEWDESPAAYNSYYRYKKNTLLFPTPILQPPNFNGKHFHPARNFGAIGMRMGHELLHAFEIPRGMYDKDGSFHLWNSKTLSGYLGHEKCFISQYSKIKLQGDVGMVRGDFTKHENVADNGGLGLAWDAYRKFVFDQKIHDELGDKMFFLAFGQSFCAKASDHFMKILKDSDVHVIGSARVNGVVMNDRNFAITFQCKPTSRMTRVDKCRLW